MDKSIWLVKLRSSQRTETEEMVKTLNESRSISLTIFSDKSNNIEQPKEIYVMKYNPILSGVSGHGASLTSEFLDKQRITRKNKRKKTLDTSIKGKESIQEPDNPSKREK